MAFFDNNKSLLFIDGELWGMFEMLEKASAHFIHSNYDILQENVALIKNNILEEGTEQDLEEFKALSNFCEINDLTLKKITSKSLIRWIFKVLSTTTVLVFILVLGPLRITSSTETAVSQLNEMTTLMIKWRWGTFDFDYTAGLTYGFYGEGVKRYAYDSFKKFQEKKDKVFNPEKMTKIIKDQETNYLKYIVKTDWRWYNGTPEDDYESFVVRRSE